MEVAGTAVPLAVVIVAVAGLVAMALVLLDLSRHDVRHLPKWAWALIIVLANFPIGAMASFVLGRVPAGEGPPPAPPQTAPALVPEVREAGDRPPTQDGQHVDRRGTVLAMRGLSKVYGDTAALHHVNLAVPRGLTYGLIGPNGAGKTTLLAILAGLRRPTRGRVEIAVPRRRLGVLVDTPQFEPWLTAREVVDLRPPPDLAGPAAEPRRPGPRRGRAPRGPGPPRRVFFRGMLQRLGLAGCLVGDPEVLLLDEPSSALDRAGRREVLDLVGRLADTKTVVLPTHILADVQQVADVVGVIDRGRLRFQGP